MRYAIDPTKIHNELGWLPETKFEDGNQETIKWYLENREWWENIISGVVSRAIMSKCMGTDLKIFVIVLKERFR
mgnify:CR=1 FL=1